MNRIVWLAFRAGNSGRGIGSHVVLGVDNFGEDRVCHVCEVTVSYVQRAFIQLLSKKKRTLKKKDGGKNKRTC